MAVLGRDGRICRPTTTITMKNIRSVASRRFKCLNVPLHTTSGRQVESIFAEIHLRVEQKADARKIGAEEGTKERRRWKNTEERGEERGAKEQSRIALQARLTGYRKAVRNSISTWRPSGKIIPSTLPSRRREATRQPAGCARRFTSLSLFLSLTSSSSSFRPS